MKSCLALLALILAVTEARHFSEKAREKWLADKTVPQGYDKRFRPPSITTEDGPVKINVTMYIQELGFCTKHQHLVVSGYLRQFWNDPRLSMSNEVIGKESTLLVPDMFQDNPVWIPDTFVVNSKNGFLSEDDPTTKGRSFLRVMADGSVLGSTRFRTKLICPVSQKDTEVTCTMTLESYGHRADNIVYNWKDFSADSLMIDAVAKSLLINNGWEMVECMPSNDFTDLSIGTYSRAQLKFKLKKVVSTGDGEEAEEDD